MPSLPSAADPRAALSRSLYPPHRHLQPSPAGLRRTRVTFRWRDYAHGSKQRLMTSIQISSCAASSFTCYPRASYASAATVCSPTASAPAAAAGTQAARRRWTRATSSAPVAELRTLALSPLRQSHASPPTLHRRTTLFRRLRFFMTGFANPVSRLVPGTRPHLCVRTILQACKTTFDAIRQQLFHRRLMPLLTSSHQHRRRSLTPESITEPRNTIQYPYIPG